jgi:MFS family permease
MRSAVAALASNRALVRVSVAWLLFILAEYSVWIAMLVYAYGRGGATTAGVVAVAQLAPGIVAGPLLSTLADRRSPVLLLVGGYVVQTAAMAVTAIVLYASGPALAAYAGAIVAATAVTATRPAQAALTPALARNADELTAANAVTNWLDSLGIMLAGVLSGLALSTGQPGLVFACGATCTTLATALLASLRVQAIAVRDGDVEPGALTAVRAGLEILKRRPQPRLLVGLLGAEYIVIGALDVLFVVLAVSVLHEGPQWTGYLNTAYGIGGMAAGAVTIGLLGRRLGTPIMVAAAAVGVGLAVTAFSHNALVTLVLLGAVGLAHAVLDMSARTLLQRTVPADLLGRIFGVVEGLSMAGLAIGSLFVPLLIHLGGTDAALIGTAAVLPLALVLGGKAIRSLDAAARVPIVEIALLRSMSHFRALPTPELEGLAHAVQTRAFADGETIIRQGDEGDLFYAIAEGQVDVRVDGIHVATNRRPEGFGEIALLRKVPRTATVIAEGPVVLYALDGAAFVTVVTGHDATRRRAEAVATSRLARP